MGPLLVLCHSIGIRPKYSLVVQFGLVHVASGIHQLLVGAGEKRFYPIFCLDGHKGPRPVGQGHFLGGGVEVNAAVAYVAVEPLHLVDGTHLAAEYFQGPLDAWELLRVLNLPSGTLAHFTPMPSHSPC